MKTKILRIISLMVTLMVFLSCAGSMLAFAVDGEEEPSMRAVIVIDEKESGSSVDAGMNHTIRIDAKDALKLVVSVTPESAAGRITKTEWKSADEDVAVIDANGVVTTGSKTGYEILYITFETFIEPSISIPFGVAFVGKTQLYMTATMDNGETFSDYVDLEVRHSFFDFLRWVIFKR